MKDEIYNYFMEQYRNSEIKVVSGHWPNFKTKEEVDEWIGHINRLPDLIQKMKEIPLDDDF